MRASSKGQLDNVSLDGWVSGWAHPTKRQKKARLDIYIDGSYLDTTIADQFRKEASGTGATDSSAGFSYYLPDDLCNSQTRTIDVRLAGTEISITDSPQSFVSTRAFAENSQSAVNLISNANFQQWPRGVSVSGLERYSEVCAGWFLDYKRNNKPDVIFSIAQANITGAPGDFGFRIGVRKDVVGYLRLLVPIILPRPLPFELSFSCTFLRSFAFGFSDRNELRIREIFLATAKELHVSRLCTIARGVSPKNSLRIQDLPINTTMLSLEDLPEDRRVVLAWDFDLVGELTLFSPSLSVPRPPPLLSERMGTFEDEVIERQASRLALSAIWEAGTIATTKFLNANQPASIANIQARKVLARGLPFVQIVVPIFNAASDVGRLLTSILECTDSPFEVLLIDDASEVYTRNRLKSWSGQDPRIKVFTNEINQGYTRSINFGLQLTAADFIVLINSDCIVTPGWIDKLHEVLSINSRVAAAGPLSNAASWQSVPRAKDVEGGWNLNPLVSGVSVNDYAGLVERLSNRAFPQFPLLNGFCTMFRKEALETVGYFDAEAFPRGYGEENDLSLRLRALGHELRIADHCYVFHRKTRSFTQSGRQNLSKRANKILRNKYPEINIAALEEEMQLNEALASLRSRLLLANSVETGRSGRVFRVGRRERGSAISTLGRAEE